MSDGERAAKIIKGGYGRRLPKTIAETSLAATLNVEPIARILGLETWLNRHLLQTLRPPQKGGDCLAITAIDLAPALSMAVVTST